ncbi:MAG: 16S rRNA (guanine(527)-N(7))-methyltransferase RsmG [Pseudomonadota bacterium]
MTRPATPQQALADGVAALSLSVSAEQQSQLLELIALLAKWSRAYNLTAITDQHEMVSKHLLDSLSIAPFVQGTRALDVGTGAGFPGLPLAIIQPDRDWVLLDSNAKKLRFIDHVTLTLGIHNVSTVHARAESYAAEHAFDTVVCRAFTALDRFAAMAQHLLASDGLLLAMKGRAETETFDDPAQQWSVENHPLVVPLLDEERHLIALRRHRPVPVYDEQRMT